MPAPVPSGDASAVDADKLFRKISWRLIPYLFVLYIFAYLDRVNLGFAASEFKNDLHLSASVFGLGAGLYFVGQLLFDLPSNLLLNKVGPRLWIARIMISWGTIATLMVLVQGKWSFYSMRLLLGISEAGFFPGIILYLSFWFPSGQRAKAVARFMTATAVAGIVGAEIWKLIQHLEGTFGLHGWQWMFLIEGIPTILFGISVLFLLKDKPDDAAWLTPEERTWLDAELERDRKEGGAEDKQALKDAFKLPMVWLLAVIFLLDQIGTYTVTFFMPLILKGVLHVGNAAGNALVDRYGAIPYIAAAILMVVVGWSSDRTGERRWHLAGCFTLAAAGFACAAYAGSLVTALLAFSLAAVGYWSMMGPFWALPTRVLGGQAAAGGVAIITMIGSLGGLAGPAVTGKLRDLTHGYRAGLLTVGALALVAAGLAFLLQAPPAKSEQNSGKDNSQAAGAL